MNTTTVQGVPAATAGCLDSTDFFLLQNIKWELEIVDRTQMNQNQ